MTTHRVDKGTASFPLMAGDPLRFDVTAHTTSGQVGSATLPVDFTGVNRLCYALFNMNGDIPCGSPAYVLELGLGVTVRNALAGEFSVELTASHTSMWQGRDWHAAKMVDINGNQYALFDGFIVSTRELPY